jgi:hypothetical protein
LSKSTLKISTASNEESRGAEFIQHYYMALQKSGNTFKSEVKSAGGANLLFIERMDARPYAGSTLVR